MKTLQTIILRSIFFLGITCFSTIVYAQAPDLTGKYEMKVLHYNSCYAIVQAENGIFVEWIPAESVNVDIVDKNLEKIWVPHISGIYKWNSTIGAYRIRSKEGAFYDIYKVSNGSLALHKSDQPLGKFEKIGQSLSSLAQSANSADVNHLLGEFNLQGGSQQLIITKGIDHQLLIHTDVDVYELNKIEGIVEKYSGKSREAGESLTVSVVSKDQLQLTLGSAKLDAQRVGTTATARTVANSGTTNVTGDNTKVKLSQAVRTEDVDAVKEIISLGTDVNAKSANGKTALHEASQKGNAEIVEVLLNNYAEINSKDNQGKTALHIALQKNDEKVVETLLENSADVNARDNTGKTPLDIAIQKSTAKDHALASSILQKSPTVTTQHLDAAINKKNNVLVDELISAGGSANHVALKATEKGNLPLLESMLDQHGVALSNTLFDKSINARKYIISDALINRGFDASYAMKVATEKEVTDLVYTALENGGDAPTALKYAVKKNDTELAAEAITTHGADASGVIKEAVKAKNAKMVELFVTNGADANEGMGEAVGSKNLQIVKILLDNGADPQTYLSTAAVADQAQMVSYMLEKGADPTPAVNTTATAQKSKTLKILLDAGGDANEALPGGVAKSDEQVIKMAIEAGADASDPFYIGTASKNGDAKIVDLLLKAGANANDGIQSAVKANHSTIVNKLLGEGADGTRAELMATAASNNSTLITQLLMDKGADPQEGVYEAVRYGSAAVLQQLIDAGADANNQDYLNYAVKYTKLDVASILIELGLDVNHQEQETGFYLIHHAAKTASKPMLVLLISNNVEVNVATLGEKDSPLHLVVSNKNAVDCAETLINAGADVNAVNGKGKLVFQNAKGSKMKRLLKKNGASKK